MTHSLRGQETIMGKLIRVNFKTSKKSTTNDRPEFFSDFLDEQAYNHREKKRLEAERAAANRRIARNLKRED